MVILMKAARSKNQKISVNDSFCLYCGACVGACPANAIFLWNSHLDINPKTCTLCGICLNLCPVRALSLVNDHPEAAQ